MPVLLTDAEFAGHFAACVDRFPVVQEVPYRRALETAKHESGLNRFIIGVNRDVARGLPAAVHRPTSEAEALAILEREVAAGRIPDAGPMQVTKGNWQAYGLTDAQGRPRLVFNTRANICAGLRILGEAYRAEASRVACRYNAGRPDCPAAYPAAIMARMAGTVVAQVGSVSLLPAIEPAPIAAPAPPGPCGPPPSSFDGWVLLRHQQCEQRAAARAARVPAGPPAAAEAPGGADDKRLPPEYP